MGPKRFTSSNVISVLFYDFFSILFSSTIFNESEFKKKQKQNMVHALPLAFPFDSGVPV